MMRRGMTVKDAAREWVKEFSAVPYHIAELLYQQGELNEITPPCVGSRIHAWNDEANAYEEGEIIRLLEDGQCVIRFDSGDEQTADSNDVDIDRDGPLPM